MKRKWAVLFFFILPLAELFLGCLILKKPYQAGYDTVKVNELAHECARTWERLEEGDGTGLPFAEFPFSVLSNQGKLLYASRPDSSVSLNEAVAHGDTIVDISISGQVVGKLILYQTASAELALREERLVFLTVTLAVVFSLAILLYTAYLNHIFFRPFRKMKAFASRIAAGNLDMPLEMDKSQAFGAFTESFDIMREELSKARLREREANESKKELVAELSHDIKTPVASIRAVAELMQVSAATEKERTQLSIIEAKAEQIDTLVSNLFHAALEELQELSITSLEQDSRILNEMIKGADYEKRAVIDTAPECIVIFDRLRLQQVFDNLFGNSYKYADTELRVTFSFEGPWLSIHVRDYGPGVSKDELPFLTDKFYRGGNSQGKFGAGLGLYLSSYLTSQMGGKLECENLKDGFCVNICLKLG